MLDAYFFFFFFLQAEDGIRDFHVTGVQTCALPIWGPGGRSAPQHGLARAAHRPPPRSAAATPGAPGPGPAGPRASRRVLAHPDRPGRGGRQPAVRGRRGGEPRSDLGADRDEPSERDRL